ncbi:MAG: PHP domain-containing protein [Deltaproteobacteria bacterium]|nr:PHP domain-containing protein [Deltaproteobacteria bacterium]
MTTDKRQYIDLHLHTNCSDGAFAPAAVVERAKGAGLSAIAIADHDSVAGVAEALAAGLDLGIEVIAAVELSVQFGEWEDVHLLGYGIDYGDSTFLERLNGFRQRRERRNSEILERVNDRLAAEGRTAIGLDEVLAYARDAIGRPHIARALLKKGYADSVEDAFRRYLVPCNVPKAYWPIADAMAEVRRIGGVSVLAHPTSISAERKELRRVVTELAAMGLDGIEAYNNLAQADEMEQLRRLEGELGLLVTGGSDFHGIEEGLEMGRGRGGIRFSAALLAPLKALLAKRRNQLLSL